MLKTSAALIALVSASLIGCDDGPKRTMDIAEATARQQGITSPKHPSAPAAPPSATPTGSAATGSKNGKVVETMSSGGYTYVQVDDGSQKFWAAAPQFTVAVGDQVTVPPGTPMTGFRSATLNRTFDVVFFVPSVGVAGRSAAAAASALPPGHPKPNAPAAPAAPAAPSAGKKLPGAVTVAECFSGASDLSGKLVTVRGKVTKFNSGIMGKNWVHVNDGTGAQGSSDLLVTTQDTVAVGDSVVAVGILATNKDFGAGYSYAVLIEEANVKAN